MIEFYKPDPPTNTYNNSIVYQGAVGGVAVLPPGPIAPPPPPGQSDSLCGTDSGVPMHGWGPERLMLDAATAFPGVNQRIDGPWGDERAFYGVRDLSGDASLWYSQLKVTKGHTYQFRVLVHNSAADVADLHLAQTRVSVNLPVCTGNWIKTNGFVDAVNTNPREVYQSLVLLGDAPFNLAYGEGTVRLCSQQHPCESESGGLELSEDLFTSKGVSVGTQHLNGSVMGGTENAVVVTFVVHPQFA